MPFTKSLMINRIKISNPLTLCPRIGNANAALVKTNSSLVVASRLKRMTLTTSMKTLAHEIRSNASMNGQTKLSEALKYNPDILDYVISLNPHDFERLRNPLMRRVMPVRITLQRLALMLNIPEQEFLNKINTLAGQPLEQAVQTEMPISPMAPPAWFERVDEKQIKWVDVLPGDEKLEDPMPPINIAVNGLKAGEVLGIKHKWQPQPLFDIWSKRGFEYWTRKMDADEWHIFVRRPKE